MLSNADFKIFYCWTEKIANCTIQLTILGGPTMTLGERIKNERIKINLSQAALGELLQITQQAVGRWEKDISEPDTTTLKKLAKLFNITLDDLLSYQITQEEQAAGASATRRVNITPIEDDLLHVFRRLGKKHGEETQRNIITMIEKML